MKKLLRILILEDVPSDAKLIQLELRKTNKEFESRVIQDEKNFLKELQIFQPDLILSDYSMPQFTGLDALEIAKKKCPEIPFIIVTGSLNEETAVKCIRWGAWDYVLKENLVHLGHAVKNVIQLRAENEKKKLAEEALCKSEEQFRLIAENTGDVITLSTFNLKATYTYVSPAIKRATGYEPEDMLGRSCFDFIHPEDKKNIIFPILKKYINLKVKKIKTEKKSNISETIEYRFKNKSGEWGYSESIGSIVGNQLLFVSRNITERKKAEKALQESEQELNTIFNGVTDGIALLDKTGKILRINKQIVKIGGYSEKEIVGKRLGGLKMLSPKSIAKMVSIFSKLAKGQDVPPYELEVYTKKREIKIIEIHNSLLRKDGKVERIIVILRDITERKKAEKKEKEHHRNIELLSETAMLFFELPSDKDIYSFIGEQLRKLIGNDSYIVINTVDKDGILTTRAVLGLGKLAGKVFKLIGRNPVGMTYDAKNEEIVSLSDGKLHLYEKGLYEISLKTIPKIVCNSMEKLLNIKNIYGIGFTKNNELFGTIVIFLKEGASKLKNKQIIETFVKQASIATQKWQVEKALEKREKQLQTLIDAMPDFVCFKDGDGRWLMVNEASIRIFQLEGIDYLGKKDSELAELNSKLRGSFLTCKESDAKVWKEGSLIQGEETIPDADGSARVFDVTKVPVSHPSGKWKGIVVLGHDITESKKAEKILQQHTLLLETIQHASAVLSSSLKLDDVLQLILDQISQAILFDSAGIFLIVGGKLKVVIVKGVNQDLIGQTYPMDNPLFQEIKSTRKPLLISNAMSDSRFKGWGETSNICSWIGIPLITREGLIGFLTLDSYKVNVYTSEHIALVQPFAAQAAQAIHNARLYQRVIDNANELEIFNKMAVGRELKMIELKKEINSLLKKSGKDPAYKIIE